MHNFISSYKGLSHEEAQQYLQIHGRNTLPHKSKRTMMKIFLSQFTSPLIYILLLAGTITFFLGHITDTLFIYAAVLVNTILGYYQESKAEKALDVLKKMLNPTAKVMRTGDLQNISGSFVVPGDCVLINRGDRVPADGKILEAIDLHISESILTGESETILKKKGNEVYMGTTVISGRGYFRVTKTGMNTMMGSIAEQLANVKEPLTPLQERLKVLAKSIALIVLVLALFVFFIGIISGRSLSEMFVTSVALAVASIPEGMVISLTVILALGMQRILQKNALVKSLVAAETLGSVTVIATDKTGTLTRGEMVVVKTEIKNTQEALRIALFANNIENPVEHALWKWVESSGLDPEKLLKNKKRTSELPFTSERKYMSVEVEGKVYVKGAPEVIMQMCKIGEKSKKNLIKKIDSYSLKGYRLIALASGKRNKLEWQGMLLLDDPVRNDVSEVFLQAQQAGIRIMMITGDYAGTALSVWKKINGDHNYIVIEGKEIDVLAEQELRLKVASTDIFARVNPVQKLRIVEALKSNNEVVALVGDGVNDAPALKKADIGIVVGEASDVSKETADIILLNSSFKTILSAIEEGRVIYDNIKKVILFLLADSFIQVILVIGSILLNLPLPLTAAQILWINFITDGIPAIALTAEQKEKDILRRIPIKKNVSIIDYQMKVFILVISLLIGVFLLATYKNLFFTLGYQQAQTFVFASIGFTTLIISFSIRSLTEPIWRMHILSNVFLVGAVIIGFITHFAAMTLPVLKDMLDLSGVNPAFIQIIVLFSIVVIATLELTKYCFFLYRKRKNALLT